MEEKELTERFRNVFEAIIPIFGNMKKGFFAEKAAALREEKKKFSDLIKSRVAHARIVIEKKSKDETEKKYITLLTAFQIISLAIENLFQKLETKAEAKILFSEKALSEIKELFAIVEGQLQDTKDYLATGNPHLRRDIGDGMVKVSGLINEYEAVHQQRLITGVCMPQASYLYLDILDSFKRITRGLADLAEKV
jgi:Na+/phosphate symporter